MYPRDLSPIILKEFYNANEHLGVMLFGSSAQNTRHKNSDIDIIILTKTISNYRHYIEKKEGYIFDIFEMPIEYGFYLLHKRDPMWLHSFSTSKIITGRDPLKKIIDTAKRIINEETTTPSREKINQLLFSVSNKYKKLTTYNNDSVKFNFFYIYCIESIIEYLQIKHEIKPKFEPGINKINRLVCEFGETSKLIEKSIKSDNKEEKISLLKKAIDGLIADEEKIEFPVNVQNIDVTYAVKFFISSLTTPRK